MKKFEELRKMSSTVERREWLGKMTKSELIAYYEAQFDKKINTSFLNSKKKVDVIQAIITLFDNTRRDEAFDNYGKNVKKCDNSSKVTEKIVEKPRKDANTEKKIAEAKKKFDEMMRKMQSQPQKEEKTVEKEPKEKFTELRKMSNNKERRDWLEKMSKPQLIAYYESQFDKKINATYLKNKSKKDVIQSIMDFYDTERRSEAMENIIV